MEKTSNTVLYEIKSSKVSEKTPEASLQFFAGLSILPKKPFLSFFKTPASIALEITCAQQTIHFLMSAPPEISPHLESQLTAQYPESVLFKLPKDYLPAYLATTPNLCFGQLVLGSPFYLPLRTYSDFKDVDPLSGILGTMSKAGPNDFLLVQILIAQAGNWQNYGRSLIEKGITLDETHSKAHPFAKQIQEKIQMAGYLTGIRLVASNSQLLANLAGSFGTYTNGEGNHFKFKKPSLLNKNKFINSISKRTFEFVPANQVLNLEELASIWHLPGLALSGIRNISWGTTLTGEPPANLPVAEGLDEADKMQINFIARTEFKNRIATFGIKRNDRRRHLYVIGKSGTGKSWLIANMAINDMRNREGIGVIDPHGDLAEILLDYVPSYRLNDVCYLDPSNVEHPFHLNPLEITSKTDSRSQKDLVASGIVSIFQKLYGHSWGPRLEYILRNTLLTLTDVPDSTFLEVPRILTDKNYRKRCIDACQDGVLINFWTNEFEKMSDNLRNEAISPILNKVGQFISSRVIRQIVGSPHSTINIEEMMNQGKILILNLPQGKIGEDNAALLGAMFITKIQLAAMNRAHMAEEERKDFFLFVDEFQNFATGSFIKILAEARKYRLCLTMANQYIGQLQSAEIKDDLSKAIFGNVGTIVSFIVGAEDAEVLASEFGQTYTEEQLVSLGKYQIVTKLCIDSLTSSPFYATTLPLPRCQNQNREKVIKLSEEKYTRPYTELAKPPEPVVSPSPILPPSPISRPISPLPVKTPPFQSPARRPYSPPIRANFSYPKANPNFPPRPTSFPSTTPKPPFQPSFSPPPKPITSNPPIQTKPQPVSNTVFEKKTT